MFGEYCFLCRVSRDVFRIMKHNIHEFLVEIVGKNGAPGTVGGVFCDVITGRLLNHRLGVDTE